MGVQSRETGRFVIRFYVTGILAGMLTGFSLLIAQERKNIEIVDSLATRIWEDVSKGLPSAGGDTLFFMLSGDAVRYQDYLVLPAENFFKSKHFSVFRNYDPACAFQSLILEIDRFNPVITYSNPYRKTILGAEYVRRKITLQVRGQVRSGIHGAVCDTLHTLKKYEDEIRGRNLDELETSGYSFTRGERGDYSFWYSVLEPVIAVSTVGVLVYLFFTQRS
jgi:hypothetical protein